MTLREFIDVCDSGHLPVAVFYHTGRNTLIIDEIRQCERLDDYAKEASDGLLDVEILSICINKIGSGKSKGTLRWNIAVKESE